MFEIQLVNGFDRSIVTGLLTPLTEKHLDDIETFWKPHLPDTAVDRDWDWAFKQRIKSLRARELENWEIEYEGLVQGVMMLDVAGRRSRLERDRPIVYVFCIATAPWNRIEIQRPPRLKAISSQLVRFAKARSFRLGFAGRVSLHALPEAEAFYRRLNMTEIPGILDDSESEIEQLTYFEWRSSPDRAF